MANAFRVEDTTTPHVATVWLSRGDAGNRLRAAEMPALGEAILAAGSRGDIKVVLVRGDGADFCRGREPDPKGTAPTTALGVRSRVTDPILGVYGNIRATPVPVIAVVQGAAQGFGCALVAGCDLALAADNASFSFPELDHDLPPTLAMSVLLHKVTPKRLLHFIYTRRAIDAEDALGLGLVSEVAPLTRLETAVDAMLAHFTDRNRAALAGVKEYMNAALYADPSVAARLAANILATVLSSPKDA